MLKNTLKIALLLIMLLAACTKQNSSGGAVSSNLEPPTLISPADDTHFDSVAGVLLAWEWSRPLERGEFYVVRVWREGQEPEDITWKTDNNFLLVDWLLTQEPGEFYWSVAVTLDNNKEEVLGQLTEQAPPMRFTVEETVLSVDDIIHLPEGFVATIYANLPVAAVPDALSLTVITFDPNGNLTILSHDGRIFTAEDHDGDGIAEDIKTIFANEGDSVLELAIGMEYYEDVLYIADRGRISRLVDVDGDGILDSINSIVEDLPSWQFVYHSNNGITFGPDGKLYTAVGASSDHGPILYKYEASVLRMNPDGSDLEIFATGFRNSVDLTFSPSGDLFLTDNGPDYGPDHIPNEERWEELNHVQEGMHYGFPDVFGFPEEGQPGEGPVVELNPHSALSGLDYYDSDYFPAHYRDGFFIAEWGSHTQPINREVIFVSLEQNEEGQYRGKWESFASFHNAARPVDVIVGPDGVLYIAEWTRGLILRVTYVGTK